jgi:hypothetical protein
MKYVAGLAAAGAHQMTGRHASVLAILEDLRSSDEGGLIAIDTLHEATTAGGKIVHEFRLVESQAIEVDQVHVGAQARRESLPVPSIMVPPRMTMSCIEAPPRLASEQQ